MASYWRQLSGQNLSSSEYLDKRIHSTIIKRFGGQTDKSWIQEEKRAKQLEKYLYQIKNFLNDDSKENIFTANEKQLLRDNLDPQLKNFLKTSGGTTFEKELVNLNLALMKIFTSETIDIETKTYQIWTGSQLNKAIENLGKDAAKAFGIKTYKYIDKKHKEKGKSAYIQSTQIKIDLITQGVEITQNISGTSQLQKFFQLYTNASFSAKNYNLTKKARDISLGSTSLGRIFFDFLPFIDPVFSNSNIISSFAIALMNRKKGINLSEPNETDERIDAHLDHIRTIYQLQGLGQSINNKNNDNIQQLQQYINRGVDFLIINDFGSDIIQVESTRALLAKFLEKEKSNIFKMRNVQNLRHTEFKI